MTWHETIEYIRKRPEYAELIENAYFEEDLTLNIERFGKSDEFLETLKIIKQLHPSACSILEIGAGNGVAAINFALKDYQVTVVEPDPSDTVGSNAIKRLIKLYHLDSVRVFETYAEDIGFEDESFDVVYIRQAMHHAKDLKKFVNESARILRKDGFLITVRDHVIFNEKDKEWFLQMHPLHKFYGGENAFTPDEYKNAMREGGLKIEKVFKYYDSILNYFPLSQDEVKKISQDNKKLLKHDLVNKLGFLGNVPFLLKLYRIKNSFNVLPGYYLNELAIPGRMYSFIARKLK